MAPSCYSCPESDSYFYWVTSQQESNPWQILRQTRNRNDYGVPLMCCYNLEEIALIEFDYFHAASNLELISKISDEYLVGAVARYLNFSQSTVEEDVKPSLFIMFAFRSQSSDGLFKQKALILFNEAYHLMYCRTQDLKKETDILSALLSPFDKTTWFMLLLNFTLMCSISGYCLCSVIDLVSGIFGQPSRMKTFGILMLTFYIALIPMQSSYRDYFTSNAVKPFEKAYIDTNQELFDSGFKMLCNASDISKCSEDDLEWYSSSFNKLKLDWASVMQYFLFPGIWSDRDQILATTRDKGTYPVPKVMAESIIFRAEKTPNTQCHVLAEYWTEETTALFYGGTFAQQVYDSLAILMQAGIGEFWNSALLSIESTESRRWASRASVNENSDDVVYMNSSIQSLFLIVLILQAMNIIFFIAECLWAKVLLQLWKTWKAEIRQSHSKTKFRVRRRLDQCIAFFS